MIPILLIDDDPTTCLVLKRALQRQGYEVIIANNGEEGIALAKELEPGLIICDWMMPGLDGLQVCQQIKSLPKLSTAFFILLTARGALEDRVMGLDSGADEFISKPIDISELQARVRAGIRVYQLSRDLQRQTARLELELSEAAQYVQALLPGSLHDDRFEVETCFIPSRQLGGDCYDFQWLDNENLAIYLADVSGHGVGAALLSVSVLNLMRARLLPQTDFYEPSSVLAALNHAFHSHTESARTKNNFFEEKYFTMWYGVYNVKTRELVYASAGHPPALLLSPSVFASAPEEEQALWNCQELSIPSLPIGMFADAEYHSKMCIVQPGNYLYVFSDGLYDFIVKDRLLWGLKSLTKFLINQTTHRFKLEFLVEQVAHFNQSEMFDDDLSIIRLDFLK
jgi:sigma-B regulation protein RsbU (phosphoserine phosphatase)